MRFHVLITHVDPDRAQEEMLVNCDDYSQVADLIDPLFGSPISVRMRVLDEVPRDFPCEVYIRRGVN